ncbi:MAG TPA: hypothetical protein DIV41_02630 [Ruminococcaceae bacterium]|nr:hypothetical protein [Oscillospiraceae bacterium]
MEKTVTIYKLICTAAPDHSLEGESCSLAPWAERDGCSGYDDGGREYVLPEGYAPGKDENGRAAIADVSGRKCGLILHNGCPIVVDRGKKLAVLLEPAKKIMRAREARGLERSRLADILGVTQKELFEWENAEKRPDEGTLRAIAEALGCKPADLI